MRYSPQKDIVRKRLNVEIVILTALGVGGSTVFGAVMGMAFGGLSVKYNSAIMSLAAGIMLAAAMLGLIIPSLEYLRGAGVFLTVAGIFSGAICVLAFDKLLLKFYSPRRDEGKDALRSAIIFVAAIAIHNLPEGIAAGVGFGTDDPGDGIFIATAIALQNIPEGMAVIVALLGVGYRRLPTFLIAALTGVVEIVGTFIGYYASRISYVALPFILALAGGSMLYVISDEMIPETHLETDGHRAAFFLLLGFCFMLVMDAFI